MWSRAARRLGACMLLLCALGAALPAMAERLMVATDLHYITPREVEDAALLEETARYGDGKMPHESEAFLSALVRQALALAPDALLLLGDQTYNGEVLSHRDVSDALAEVQAAGIAVYAIPGNHDINNDNAFAFTAEGPRPIHSIPLARYEKYYGAYGLAQAFSRAPDSFSYAVKVSDALWIVMIEGGIFEPFAEPFALVSDATLAWMETVLRDAEAAGAQAISASHQSLLAHSDLLTAGYMVVDGGEIARTLEAHGVRLHLSGHLHVQHIARQGALYEVSLSALSNQPGQYAVVDIAPDGAISLAMHSLDAAYLPDGLPERAVAFFHEASYGKAFAALRDSGLPEAKRAEMAEYAAVINRHYYAGTLHTLDAAYRDGEAYALWQAHGAGSFWQGYLASMLREADADMTRLALPAR